MFFFVQDDSRLTGKKNIPQAPCGLRSGHSVVIKPFFRQAEGPRLFCCSPHLEEQKEQWEERRSALRMVGTGFTSTVAKSTFVRAKPPSEVIRKVTFTEFVCTFHSKL